MRLRLKPSVRQPPPREALRLDLVAAATEIVVLAELMRAELSPIAHIDAVQELLSPCRENRRAARKLLSLETVFDASSEAQLRAELDAFESRLAEVRILRQQGDELFHALCQPRAMRSFTWWPGETESGPSVLMPQGWWPRKPRQAREPLTRGGQAARSPR